jgi:hypothetical protein
MQSVLRQVHSLFQSAFPTQCDLVLPPSVSSILRSALFRGITQRRVVILYRRFGTTYLSHLRGSRSPRRVPTFRNNVSVTSSRVKDSKKSTDVSGQRIYRIFKGQEFQEEYRRFGTTYLSHLRGSRSPRRVPTFRDNVSVTSSRVKKPKKSNTPEERRSHQHRGGSLKFQYLLFSLTPSSSCLRFLLRLPVTSILTSIT